MKGYSSDKIRNIVLLGHGGVGKTTFLEAALLNTKVVSRLGKVEDGSTVSDYEMFKIKKCYHSLAKLIHPDLHPDLEKDPKIMEKYIYFSKIIMVRHHLNIYVWISLAYGIIEILRI